MSFLIGEKGNQLRCYEQGFFRLQNTQTTDHPCSMENRRIISFKGREESSRHCLPPPLIYICGCHVGNQLKQGWRTMCVGFSCKSSFLAVSLCVWMQFNKLESYGEKINISTKMLCKIPPNYIVCTNLGRMTSQKISEPNQSPQSSPSLRGGKMMLCV